MNLFENLQTLKESTEQLFGVDIRNMRTGIHALAIFDNEDDAIECEKSMSETESGECLTYIPQVNFLEEIDYHDFENTDNGKFYDDIKIVNVTAVDVYDI